MRVLEDFRLYCFSPGGFLRGRDPLEMVTAQIRGGADIIQLREKDMPRRARLELGFKLRDLTRREGVMFIVNDDIDLALILDADGVHLGQEDIPIHYARPLMKEKIIGISTHSAEQASEAQSSGADYIGVGPIFATTTKPDRENVVGLELLRTIKDFCHIPYVAIGGIGEVNIESVVKTGCKRVAVISDVLNASNIEERCFILRSMLP